MAEKFRKLNDNGLAEFKRWILDGEPDEIPVHLLKSPNLSNPSNYAFSTDLPKFEDRYEFGRYLVELLKHIPTLEIENDINFWSSLALRWFESISDVDKEGFRIIRKDTRYVLKLNWHDYRHLIRTPWLMYRMHEKYSKIFLKPFRVEPTPLAVTNEILNDFGSRASLLRNKPLVKLYYKLYYDEKNDCIKSGFQSKGKGGSSRTGVIVRQLSLTYDIERMKEYEIFGILPREFDRWKDGVTFD